MFTLRRIVTETDEVGNTTTIMQSATKLANRGKQTVVTASTANLPANATSSKLPSISASAAAAITIPRASSVMACSTATPA